jgi:hypothetical protein
MTNKNTYTVVTAEVATCFCGSTLCDHNIGKGMALVVVENEKTTKEVIAYCEMGESPFKKGDKVCIKNGEAILSV